MDGQLNSNISGVHAKIQHAFLHSFATPTVCLSISHLTNLGNKVCRKLQKVLLHTVLKSEKQS